MERRSGSDLYARSLFGFFHSRNISQLFTTQSRRPQKCADMYMQNTHQHDVTMSQRKKNILWRINCESIISITHMSEGVEKHKINMSDCKLNIEKVLSSWYDSIWMGQLWLNGIYDGSKEGNVFTTSVGRMREREINSMFICSSALLHLPSCV